MKSRFGKGILLLFYLIPCYTQSQEYPEWFLFQEKINCAPIVVGYSNPFHHDSSSIEQAFNNGCVNYARQLATQFYGGQAFWDTEIGSFWLGSDFTESFDTAAISIAASSLQTLDHFSTDQLFIVLLSPNECNNNIRGKVNLRHLKKPKWLKNIPNDKNYNYAVGIAPQYHYEASSWLEAERMARKNLACNHNVSVKNMQQKEQQFWGIQSEELWIGLKNIEVVARWRDFNNKIFYVLMRVNKNT